ncbi:MAG: DinB family protein [Bacteroidota bacterium]
MLTSFKSSATYFLDWNLERIARCLEELTEDQIWLRPNEQSNSIGNQLLHLEGNIRQWAVHGLGGAPDIRTRATEFAATEGQPKEELLAALTTTIEAAKAALAGLTEAEMARERRVQAYVHDGTFILLHVVEHLSYHTGQIIFWTKAMKNIDLDFYGGVDLDANN